MRRKITIFLNAFLDLKSKYIIQGAIAQIEKQQGRYKSVSLENPNVKKQIKPKQNN